MLIIAFGLAVVAVQLPVSVHADESTSEPTISSLFTQVLTELSDPKYKGKQTGTPEYNQSLNFLEEELRQVKVVPLLDERSYRQDYPIKVATLRAEHFTVDGARLSLMTDYMPFSRTGIGQFEFKNVFFAGAGQDDDYPTQLPPSTVVVFRWRNDRGTHGGVDRVLIAKKHGASGVMIIAEDDLLVGNYEHPVNGEDIGLPATYISRVAAEKYLGVPVDSYSPSMLKEHAIEISLDIERRSGTGTNLVGVIPGKREDRAVLITTNLDGFGSLPDGRTFASSKASSVSPAMLIELANYYQQHQPEYTIIIAMVGSKWTGNEGIRKLAETIDFSNVALAVDLYAMGGMGQPLVNYTDQSSQELAKRVAKSTRDVIYNPNDFGNALSSVLSQNTKKLLLVRDRDTWIDNSLDDTPDKVNLVGAKEGLVFLDRMIKQAVAFEEATEDKGNSSPSSFGGDALVPELNKHKNYVETSHYQIYYDDEFGASIDQSFVNEMDGIYARISKYHYYPRVDGKVKVYFFRDEDERSIATGRLDNVGKYRTGGGMASFDRLAIACAGPALGTVAHELNHLFADLKGFGKNDGSYKNGVAQESQGQSFLVFYKKRAYVQEPALMINNYLQDFEAPDVLERARNYRTKLNWDSYFIAGTDTQTDWQNSYHTLGSIYSFLYYTYGPNAARRAMYRIYDLADPNAESFINALRHDTGLSSEQFLDGWSSWMTSSGSNPGDRVRKDAAQADSGLQQFDYAKIYTLPSDRISQSSASKPANGLLLQLQGVDLKVFQIGFAVRNGLTYLSIEYESGKRRDVSLFDPPDGNQIKKIVRGCIVPGRNTVNIELTDAEVTHILGVDGLTVRFGFDDQERNFAYMNRDLIRSLYQATEQSPSGTGAWLLDDQRLA